MKEKNIPQIGCRENDGTQQACNITPFYLGAFGDIGDAAGYLCVTTRTVRNWFVLGFPFYKAGHSLKFRKSDIDAWMASRRVGG